MKNSELRLAIMQKRIENNKTQAQLAEDLNVSQKSVSMWENGETVPREPMRIKLAQVFGLPIDYFLDIEEASSVNVNEAIPEAIKITDKAMVDGSAEHDEVGLLAEALLNKYDAENIDLLITKLKMYR